MSGVITLLCHDRPETTQRALQALEVCEDRGRWDFIVVADDATPEVIAEIGHFAGMRPTVYHRIAPHEDPIRQLQGRGMAAAREARVSRATFDALALGFARADLVLHLEDDVVLARDALTFVEWAAERYRADRDVFSISTFNHRPGPRSPRDAYSVRKEPGWVPTGWATWRDRWEELRAGWGWADTPWHDRAGRPWDDVVNQEVRAGRCHVFPVVSRSQHIGHEGGSPHTPRVEASAFAGDLVLPPWHELEAAA